MTSDSKDVRIYTKIASQQKQYIHELLSAHNLKIRIPLFI